MLPRVVDQAEEKLAAMLTRTRCATMFARVKPQLGEIVRTAFTERAVRQNAPGDVMCPALEQAIKRVEARVSSWARGLASAEWLFLLRRVEEDVFSGNLRSTFAYDRGLAEVLSSRSGADRKPIVVPPPDFFLLYEVEERTIQQLARFIEGVRYLSNLHVAYRWAAKGARTSIRHDGVLHWTATSHVRTSVQLYDQRVDRAGQPRTGTILLDNDRTGPASILRVWGMAPEWVRVDLPSTPSRAEVRARFFARGVSIAGLRAFAPDLPARGWPHEVEILLLMARLSMLYVRRHRAGIPALLQRGYLSATAEFFEQVGDEVLTNDEGFLKDFPLANAVRSGKELVSAVAGLRGNAWPIMAGPIIRHAGEHLYLDVLALSHRIEAVLQHPPTQGAVANARAQHFEDAVQSAIDDSPWRPTEALRAMRRRTLRRNGADLTDIDAIGERGGVLLCVSCKSMIHTDEHDRGAHKFIRNAAQAVDSAAGFWRKTVSSFAETPGGNFDFTAYSRVVGVVCTPHVVYTEVGDATAEVADGLRACASYAELAQWLAAGGT
jgi:hypothetical protein